MKKLTTIGLSALTISVMAGLTFTPASAEWWPEGFSDWQGTHVLFEDTQPEFMSSAAFQNRPGGLTHILCESPKKCLESENIPVLAKYFLPLCTSATRMDCIAGLTTIVPGKGETFETLQQLSGPTVDGDPDRGYFGGSGPILAIGDENYLVRARISYQISRLNVNPFELRVEVSRVSKKVGSEYRTPEWIRIEINGVDSLAEQGNARECLWQGQGICWERAEHDFDTEYRLDLKISDNWGGFIRGRLLDPQIKLDAISGGSSLMVQGRTMKTQKVFIKTDPTSWSTEKKLAWCLGGEGCTVPIANATTIISSQYAGAAALLELLREDAADTARAIAGEWSFRITDSYNAGACTSKSNGFLGMVTTNAPVIQDGFPALDSGYLNYKVAGLHYAPDGKTVNEGTYDFVLRSDVARCIYGFTNAPVSATVAVVGEQGEEKVATTLVSETDGWLKLSAYGFTFSEKEIQVRLSQSQIKTLASFSSRGTTLSNSQKSQIRSVLAKSDGNTKFICTGIRYFDQPMSDNIKVIKRAKAACDYAKTIRPEHSYWYQTKVTQSKSYNGKVLVVSK
jgi:hypothetical protein